VYAPQDRPTLATEKKRPKLSIEAVSRTGLGQENGPSRDERSSALRSVKGVVKNGRWP